MHYLRNVSRVQRGNERRRTDLKGGREIEGRRANVIIERAPLVDCTLKGGGGKRRALHMGRRKLKGLKSELKTFRSENYCRFLVSGNWSLVSL